MKRFAAAHISKFNETDVDNILTAAMRNQRFTSGTVLSSPGGSMVFYRSIKTEILPEVNSPRLRINSQFLRGSGDQDFSFGHNVSPVRNT